MARKKQILWITTSVVVFGLLYWGLTSRTVEIISETVQYTKEQSATTTPPTSPVSITAGNQPQSAMHETRVFGSIPYWDQEKAVADFKEHADAYDIISLFWYRIDRDGSIGKYRYAKEDLSLLSYARERGVQVFALISNLPDNGDWDANRVDTAIGTPEDRAAHVAAIVALAEEKDFDGINIDYEFLRDSQTEDFSAFITELAAALHKDGRLLAVAIHAQYPGSLTRGQDLRALQAADILAFMTYDEHWETSEPGPVASLPWVRQVLSHASSLGIDHKKIFLGLPLYGYDWREGGSAEGREYEDVVRIANSPSADMRFDAFSASPVVTYESEGVQRELWFENVESFAAKYRLVDEYGLGGVHLWRLGRQDHRIYDLLQ